MTKKDSFSWEKVPLASLQCLILKTLLEEGHPLSQSFIANYTHSTIGGTCKALKELEFLGLAVCIKQDLKAYILNPYRKEEIRRFISGYDLGKNKPLVLSGHASVYCADVNNLPEAFLEYLENNEKFIHNLPKNWDSYCKRVLDGTIMFNKSKNKCRVYFYTKTFGFNPKIIEMINSEKIINLIKTLEEKYDGLKIGNSYILARCPWQEYAIQKDLISVEGIALGIKHKKLEQSYDYPEWEEKGKLASENIHTIISLREFCVENEIDEKELWGIKDILLKEITKIREKNKKGDKDESNT